MKIELNSNSNLYFSPYTCFLQSSFAYKKMTPEERKQILADVYRLKKQRKQFEKIYVKELGTVPTVYNFIFLIFLFRKMIENQSKI